MWWHELVKMTVATACVVTVLLVSAQNPGMDEITRGVPAAMIAYLVTRLTGQKWNL